METRKKIELSPIEVTAYWWTNSIKGVKLNRKFPNY